MQTTTAPARDISDSEWRGFQGAISWPTDSLRKLESVRPLVRAVGENTLAMADVNGIGLCNVAKDNWQGFWSISLPRESARLFLNALTVEVVDGPPEYLRQLGFEEI